MWVPPRTSSDFRGHVVEVNNNSMKFCHFGPNALALQVIGRRWSKDRAGMKCVLQVIIPSTNDKALHRSLSWSALRIVSKTVKYSS